MASVGFGSSVAAVAPASSTAAGRRCGQRRTRVAVPAATRGTPAPSKKEKGVLDFIISAIVKDEQEFIETNPLLNKVDGPAPSAGGTASRKAGGTTSSKKPSGTTSSTKPAAEEGGGGFKLGGLFAKKG